MAKPKKKLIKPNKIICPICKIEHQETIFKGYCSGYCWSADISGSLKK